MEARTGMCIKIRWRGACGLLGLALCGVFVANQQAVQNKQTRKYNNNYNNRNNWLVLQVCNDLHLSAIASTHIAGMRVQTNNPRALAALHTPKERRSSLILHHVRLRSFRDDRSVCIARLSPPLHREYRLIRPSNLKLSIFSVISPLPVAASTVPFAIDGASRLIFDVSVVTCFSILAFIAHVKQRSWQQREPLHRDNALRVDQHR